ncbi:MAG: RNA-binding S4 domain-containing protein [Rhodobiaceae bacterium]|nr:RNA-binding S4 domain-containing protein [Rhodobiaceae bacterium]
MTDAVASQRIDRWLWHARIIKSRTQAAELAAGGHVRVNRHKIQKASHTVKAGDVITLFWGGRVRVLEVVGFAERRGPASQAATLYADRSPPPAAAPQPDTPVRDKGTGRPTKKDRRRTDDLRDGGLSEG